MLNGYDFFSSLDVCTFLSSSTLKHSKRIKRNKEFAPFLKNGQCFCLSSPVIPSVLTVLSSHFSSISQVISLTIRIQTCASLRVSGSSMHCSVPPYT